MFDLQLFRKPTFDGAAHRRADAVRRDVRDVPVPHAVPPDAARLLAAADRPALPAVHGRLVLRGGGVGRLSDKVPVRVLLGGGLAMVGRRPAADARPDADLGLDDAASRVHHRRRRRRVRQPGARDDRDRRRPAAAQRDGIGDQQHLPTGRDRDRNRGARRDLREHDLEPTSAPKLAGTAAAGHAPQIAHAVAAAGTQQVLAATPASVPPEASAAIHVAFTHAMNDILLVAGIIALTGAVARAGAGARAGLRHLRRAGRAGGRAQHTGSHPPRLGDLIGVQGSNGFADL